MSALQDFDETAEDRHAAELAYLEDAALRRALSSAADRQISADKYGGYGKQYNPGR